MRYRNQTLVYIINFHVIVMIFIYFGWMSTLRIWKIIHFIPEWTVHIPIGLSCNSLFMLLALKAYLLYYEQQYHLAIMHATYNENNFNDDWFIQQR
eukprot:573083_1